MFRLPTDEGEVTLTQGRVYLLPSGRGVAVIATGLVMLLVGMNYGVSLAYLAAFLIAGYMVCALIAAFRNMVNLRITLTKCEDAHAGEAAVFHFDLFTERDRYFIVLASAEAVVMVDRLRLGSTPVRLAVPTRTRGVKTLGRVRLQSIAPTGLIRAFSYVHFAAQAAVYPALLRPTPALPQASATPQRQAATDTSGLIAQTSVGSGDAIDGLREFRAGDSLARVAWNAVARGHAWRTKLVAADVPHTRVLTWAHTAQFGDINTRLSALATWVVEAHRRGESFGLRLPGLDVPTARGAEHRRRCLVALAKAQL